MEFPSSKHDSEPPAKNLWERVDAAIVDYEEFNGINLSMGTLIGLLYELGDVYRFAKKQYLNGLAVVSGKIDELGKLCK